MRTSLTKLVVLTIGVLAIHAVAAAQNLKVKGSIGIGTATPAGPLHILGASAPPSGLASGQNGLLLGSYGDASAKWIQSYDGPLVLNPTGNNVGIGTTSAAYPLDVNGITRIIGDAAPTYTGSLAFGLQFGVVGGSYRWIQSFETQPLAINPGGNNVGIGTTAPRAQLDITAAGAYSLTARVAASDGGSYLAFGTPTTEAAYLQVGAYGNVNNIDNKGRPLVIVGTSHVGIGTSTPAYLLHVNGAAAGTSWTNLSSREFKQNIARVPAHEHQQMLENVMQMALTRYEYKQEHGGDGQRKLGFIAEEMPKEVLSKDGKGVDTYELLAYTIGALKAQQREIEALKARLDSVCR